MLCPGADAQEPQRALAAVSARGDQGPVVILGGEVFLMSEVPLESQKMRTKIRRYAEAEDVDQDKTMLRRALDKARRLPKHSSITCADAQEPQRALAAAPARGGQRRERVQQVQPSI